MYLPASQYIINAKFLLYKLLVYIEVIWTHANPQ